MPPPRTVFAPELLFWEGELQSGLCLEVGEDGRIHRVHEGRVEGATALPRRALLPGMVNGHSHAFQRLIRGRTEYVSEVSGRDDFWSWRESMYRAAGAMGPDDVFVVSRQAFLEMVRAGITTVGEFHYLHHQADGTPYADRNELAHQVIRAATEVGLRICLLRVGYARAGFNVEPNPRQRRFIDPDPETFLRAVDALSARHRGDRAVRVGLAPHSVRAVTRDWLTAVGVRPECIHMHVSEQPAEIAACRAEHGKTPVELLDEVGLLRPDFTAVHAVHLEPHEVQLLGRGEVTICACPSTEANLGDGIVRADELLRAGAQVSLGSDSQATIDLLGEARQLENHLRLLRLRRAVLDPGGGRSQGLARRLFQMATVSGARSLGLGTGTFSVGSPADFFSVDLDHPSLAGAGDAVLPALVFSGERDAIREVYVGGKAVVSEGRHPLEEVSARAFDSLCKRVFS
ncbi:MAG: formimidoylglutamate deiminase [Myxococcota bacterium]|nr:formimidoylglutamate deiminase [Myxococcota bacterium]